MAAPQPMEASDGASLASIQNNLRAMSAKIHEILQAQESRIQAIDDKVNRLVRAVEEGVSSLDAKSDALPDAICRPLARRWADTSQVVDEALARTNARLDRIEKDLDDLPDKLRSTRQKVSASVVTSHDNEGFWPTTAVSSSTPHHFHSTTTISSSTNPPQFSSQRPHGHSNAVKTPIPSFPPPYVRRGVSHNISELPILANASEGSLPGGGTPNSPGSSFRATTCRAMWHLWFHGDPATGDGPLRRVVLDESVGGSVRMQQSRAKVVMETLCQLGRVAADDVSAMSPDASDAVFDRAFQALLFDNPEGNLAGAVGKLRPDKAESYMVATVYNVLVNERRKRKRDTPVEIHML